MRKGLLLLVALVSCYAQSETGFLNPQDGGPPAKPKASCAQLYALTGFDLTIESAVSVPGENGTPSFCRVMGQILPEIRFEVSLPEVWNRRFLMTGNGGYAGDSLDSPQRLLLRSIALKRGFVQAITNTGHDNRDEPLATFAVNRQKLIDYAFRSLHVTAEAGKRIAAAYYGTAPARSYFQGCSTGGRQALILAQRFPQDFDGIVAGAPVLNFSATMTAFAYREQALAAAPVPYSKLAKLSEHIYAQCDEKDGVKDGLIGDPRRCDFRPARDLPRCAAGADNDTCFTEAQIGTLEKVYGDITVSGKRIYPGWPVGAEVTGSDGRSGWDNWIVREKDKTIAWGFADSFFRYMAFPRKQDGFELPAFSLEKIDGRLGWIHEILDATNPDLTGFRDRKGKLLMYFGWADPSLNAMMGVEYYESALQKMGDNTRDFFRLFMQPGVFHCGGGPGAGTFEPLLDVVAWTEQQKVPTRIEAAQVVNGKPVRTRPLCPYPERAKYSGSGSIDDAKNFVCAQP